MTAGVIGTGVTMSSLRVIVVTQINAIKSARSVGIGGIWFIVRLNICAQSVLTVTQIVQAALMKHHLRAAILQYPVLC